MDAEENQKELDKFFEGIRQESPKLIDEQPAEPAKEEAEESNDDVATGKMNRQQRRSIENASIRKQLEDERVARAAAEARAQALSETRAGDGKVDDRLLRLYGDNENGRLAAQLHQEMLESVKKQAADEAYARFQNEQKQAQEEENQASAEIDENLSALEEAFDVDLTSNSPAGRKTRTDFLNLVEKLSPKDSDGNIVEFADFESTFELFQQSRKKDNSQKKELADRTMTKSSGESNLGKQEDDKNRSWLRSMGINV